ncbi:MAG TPA: hypothetical protein VJZ76_11770 [Thermoanaerobaculia bacterium]|nr:hypothetical protein [Thermoanaerobaculia bacterium]
MDRQPDSESLPAYRQALGALAAPGVDVHLSDDELDVLVDERVDDASYRLAASHAESCAMCREEVEDLRRFDAEGRVVRFPASTSKRWLMAAAAVFIVVALSTIALFVRRTTPGAPVAVKAPLAAPHHAVVASLADGAGRIALLDNGAIDGVAMRSPRDAEDARAVLSGRALSIPTFIAAMPGAVRGGNAGTHPLRAIEPFRSAVLDARPRFSWTPVRGARGYRAAVFDADYEEIARSGELTGTSWTPSKALPAGVDLSWHVVADTEGGEISSAGAERAEAVFRVLPSSEAAEVRVGETQYGDSHLLRGLLYSRHGLLHDAEREFRQLAEQNPDSPIARRLIALR